MVVSIRREKQAGWDEACERVTHTLQQVDKSKQSREGIARHNLVHGYFHSEGIGYCTQQVGDVHSGVRSTNSRNGLYHIASAGVIR